MAVVVERELSIELAAVVESVEVAVVELPEDKLRVTPVWLVRLDIEEELCCFDWLAGFVAGKQPERLDWQWDRQNLRCRLQILRRWPVHPHSLRWRR